MSARVTGSGAIQIGPPQCDGEDALGGQTVAAAHPGRIYPPFPLTEAEIPPPGGPQGYFFIPAAVPPGATQTFAANATPSGFNPTTAYGTPDDGSIWGLEASVMMDYDHVRSRWEFTVSPDNPICAAVISVDGSLPIPDSYDGHPFNAPAPGDHSLDSHYTFEVEAGGAVVASTRDILSHVLPESFGGYAWLPVIPTEASSWAIVYDAQLGGGGFDGFHFFGQLRIVSFLLYTLGSRGARAIPGSGSNRNYR